MSLSRTRREGGTRRGDHLFGSVAQHPERRTHNPGVAGGNPAGASSFFLVCKRRQRRTAFVKPGARSIPVADLRFRSSTAERLPCSEDAAGAAPGHLTTLFNERLGNRQSPAPRRRHSPGANPGSPAILRVARQSKVTLASNEAQSGFESQATHHPGMV